WTFLGSSVECTAPAICLGGVHCHDSRAPGQECHPRGAFETALASHTLPRPKRWKEALMSPSDTAKPHSAEYFGDSRDFWWNADFLALMAARWNVTHVRTMLDVGCGIGHWGRTLAPVLPSDVRVTGIDREAAWVEKATQRAREAG